MGWFSSKKKETHSGFMGDMSEEQTEALVAFKKVIEEENLTNDPRYDDYYLLRFLRARKFDLAKTTEMFQKFLDWRIEHRVDEAMVIYKCPSIHKAKELYPHGYHGTDKEGRPFYIDQPCKFHIDDLTKIVDRDELYQYYVREYERLLHVRFPACSAAAGRKIEQTFSLLSIEGFTMGKLKEKSREFIKLAISIGQDNYPEIMAKMYIVNSPFVFKAAWAVIGPFMDEKTRKKISIVGGKYQKELLTYVDAENVPAEFGGECTCGGGENACFYSDKGPWNEYPGDAFGEASKLALLEEEKKEAAEQECMAKQEVDPAAGASIPVPAPAPVSVPAPTPAPVSVPQPTVAQPSNSGGA